MKKTIVISIAVILTTLVGLGAFLFFTVATERPCGGSPRNRCTSNLSQFGKASVMYRMDHSDQWPPSLAELAPDYVMANSRIFWCPACGHPKGASTNLMDWTSYVSAHLPSNAPPESVHAFCPPENHGGDGANVLFADGSVTWHTKELFDELIRKQDLTEIRERHQQHLRHVRK